MLRLWQNYACQLASLVRWPSYRIGRQKKLRTAARTVFPESRRHGINAQVRAIGVPTVKVDHASQEGLAANGEQRSPAREP
jgi:hypothetical protein